jgi:hypothetical protein
MRLHLKAHITRQAYLCQEIVHLKNYLEMDEADKGRELASVFPHLLSEFLEEEPYEEVSEFITLFGEDGDFNYDSIYSMPDALMVKFFNEKQYDAMNHDAVECPSYMHLEFDSVFKDGWLIHFCDDPYAIATDGFKYGFAEMEQLGLTTWFKNRKRGIGYNFAFDINYNYPTNKYGTEAVIFRASGIEVSHFGDEEQQIIFWGPSARNIVPVSKNGYDDEWYVGDESHPYFKAADLDKVVGWIEANHYQYSRKLNYRRKK